ncbi:MULTISPECIES: ion transporter [Nitrosopumilus]|uniref:Ion transport protein n=1 Tax=Nitrosopumilus piranensis TaxID=1582439 RepID=A0A0C5BZ92_9ARCH|nr:MULTISPECIES: ion transporter [Nitrosopumilus]AJM92320.1 Ion transport protein [Nitrosopumilus piranensis]KAF6244258.1 potassium channel protein [Nitrosopumilus sp. b2]
MVSSILQRTYEILEGTTNDKLAKGFQIFIISLISVNVLVVIIETEESVLDEYGYFFTPFEVFSIIVFTGEYAGRLIVCKLNPKYQNKKFALLRLVFSPMMLVDLAAILPFFLPFIVTDVRFIRIIRLLRLFRLFKLARYSEPMQTLGEVFKSKAGDLAVAFFILFIVLIFASSLMYHAEHQAQPEVFSSIPTSMWWGVITLTTIGYGDVYPITLAGKIIGAGVAILGIAVYAIPTGIMASAFTEELRRRRETENKKCPHCGKDITGI